MRYKELEQFDARKLDVNPYAATTYDTPFVV